MAEFNYLMKTSNKELKRETCLKMSLLEFSLNGFIRVDHFLDDKANLWYAKSIKNIPMTYTNSYGCTQLRVKEKSTLVFLKQ